MSDCREKPEIGVVVGWIGHGVTKLSKFLIRAASLIGLLQVPTTTWAQDCDQQNVDLEGLPITEISIDNRDIFDTDLPEENLLVHRLGNKLHIKTRKETIENQLLIKAGDPYSEQLLRETERLLRSRDYIHDARIESDLVCGEGVRLTVVTTDNWTLSPSISVSRSGGETRTVVEIEESNLLGYGTQLKVLTESDEDRDSDAIAFRDSNWFGNFKILDLEFADNSDGHRSAVSLERPFIQQDSRYAWSIQGISFERENPIYEEGDKVASIGEETEAAEVSFGWSGGLVNGSVSRHRVGWAGIRQDYFTVDDPALELPENVENYYPFYEYEYLRLKYTEKVNFLVMGVTEDIELGNRFAYRIGWKDEAYDATQEGHVFALNYDFGSFISPQTLAIYNLKLEHENNRDIDDTGRFEAQSRFYHFLDEHNSYQFNGSFQAAQNPELFEQIEIGGDSGLKGYPVRFQNGERALTLSAERRIYFNVYLWRLFKFGFAAFAEVGSAWNTGDNPVWLGDVGGGVRLVSTRQSASKVLHIDIAFPLSETGGIDDYQLFVKAKTEF
jgi:hypothetical protein